MTGSRDHNGHVPLTKTPAKSGHSGHGGGLGWMMIACCIPMIVIAVALVAIGVASTGFLLVAVACTAMMALMMGGMHGHGDKHRDESTGAFQPPGERTRR